MLYFIRPVVSVPPRSAFGTAFTTAYFRLIRYNGYKDSLSENSTVTGVGITMEGIWTNYPMFEATLLMSWQTPSQMDVKTYWESYSVRRYGQVCVCVCVCERVRV